MRTPDPTTPRGAARPARTEILQGLSGLLLVLFVWAHMFFESSILLGKEAMYWVTGMFEGRHVFGEPYPAIVSAIALLILALVALHAWLALAKFPAGARQRRALRRHIGELRHTDTTLWYVQVVTGFVLFFLVPVHLYTAITQPENIGPYASSDRVWTGRYWPMYVLLLISVHVHAGVGIYRLVMKWTPPTGKSARADRVRLGRALTGVVAFFLVLGTASLLAYVRIGMDHADRAGERYVPPHEAGRAAG